MGKGNRPYHKHKQFTDALRRAVNEPATKHKCGSHYVMKDKTDYRRLHIIVDKLVRAAEGGEPWAIKEVMDRIDGKVSQQIEHDASDGPITIQVINFSELAEEENKKLLEQKKSSESDMIDITPSEDRLN